LAGPGTKGCPILVQAHPRQQHNSCCSLTGSQKNFGRVSRPFSDQTPHNSTQVFPSNNSSLYRLSLEHIALDHQERNSARHGPDSIEYPLPTCLPRRPSRLQKRLLQSQLLRPRERPRALPMMNQRLRSPRPPSQLAPKPLQTNLML
jgi:hypothetical protein